MDTDPLLGLLLSVLIDVVFVAVVIRGYRVWRGAIREKGRAFRPLAQVETWCCTNNLGNTGGARCGRAGGGFVRRVCRARSGVYGCALVLGALVTESHASLVGGVDSPADREVLTDRCAQLVRLKLDIQLPSLTGLAERRALAAGEEYAAQRRYKESLTQYLKARSISPHPVLHFLVGISCVKLGMYRHAEAALKKAIRYVSLQRL